MARKKNKVKTKEVFVDIPFTIPIYYVYYDNKTGKLLSITNELDKTLDTYIEVDHDEIAGFFTAEKNWHDYLVAHVKVDSGKFVPTLILKDTPIYDFKNNELVHIRQHLSDNPDLLVRWDGTTDSWNFSFRQGVTKLIKDRIRYGSMSFFVTLNDDFDFLIRRINLPTSKLFDSSVVSIPFESKYERDKNKISISMVDLFITYNLEIYE